MCDDVNILCGWAVTAVVAGPDIDFICDLTRNCRDVGGKQALDVAIIGGENTERVAVGSAQRPERPKPRCPVNWRRGGDVVEIHPIAVVSLDHGHYPCSCVW